MKGRRYTKKFLAVILVLSLVLSYSFIQSDSKAYAEETIIPTPISNTSVYRMISSAMAATESGYVRIAKEMNGYDWTGNLIIENYDDSFNITSRFSLEGELPVYGGFYSGSDAYYIVYGKNNLEEDDNAEVVRVVKYSKNWDRLGSCSIKSGSDDEFAKVRYPFDGFGVDMCEVNGKLYIATAHEGYVDPQYNQGHTGFYMIQVDEATMQGKVVDYNLWHSFSQDLAAADKDHIYCVEESEGSRGTIISRFSEAEPWRTDAFFTLEYGGERTSAWAIPTYASSDGIAVTSSHVIAVGSSVDQTRYGDETYDGGYNIYMSVTPINNFTKDATTFKWMTQDNTKYSYSDIKLVKVNDNRLVLIWQRADENASIDTTDTLTGNVLHYAILDAAGNKIGEYTANATISDCDPCVKDGKVVFYTSSNSAVNFYSIDSSNGVFSRKCYSVAGPNATWSFENGTLRISGTGKINDNFIDGLSTIKDSINSVVIDEGITEIGKNAFTNIGDGSADEKRFTSIVIPDGVTKIGEGAFAYCRGLRDVYIPDSVTEIGEDAFFYGSYWIWDGSKVYYVTIHCNPNSYASQYAASTGIALDETGSTEPSTDPDASDTDTSDIDTSGTDSGSSGTDSGSSGTDSGSSGKGSNSKSSRTGGEWKDGTWIDQNGNKNENFTMKWKTDGTHWWILDNTGWRPVSQWQKIDGLWYYFDEDGFMATNEWRDGYYLGGDGALRYDAIGSWHGNETGWWFEDTSGWYPYGQWQKINGKWYYFDSTGYMCSNEWRDGCWLSSSGAWEYEAIGYWKGNASGWWFEDTSGWYPYSQWQKINGAWYWFDASGYWTN